MRHDSVRLFTDHLTGDTVLMGQYPDGIWMEVGRKPREATLTQVIQMVRLEMGSLTPETVFEESL